METTQSWSMNQWINKMWYIHTKTKKNKIQICANNMDELWKHYERSQSQKTTYCITWFPLYEMSRRGKFTETKSVLKFASIWGKENQAVTGNWYLVSFWHHENRGELDSCEMSSTWWIYHKPLNCIFKRVHFMAHEF